MTGADFIAACFWPIVVVLAVLRRTVHDPKLLGWIKYVTGLFVVLCTVLFVAYGSSSLVAIVDLYLFMTVLAIGLVWYGLRALYFFLPNLTSKLKACAAVLGGVALALLWGTILFQDFLQSRIVIEGRVRSVRTEGKHHNIYIADIAGQTVKVTTPVHERLKFLPVVRVEVGRGSGYVFNIEYLAN